MSCRFGWRTNGGNSRVSEAAEESFGSATSVGSKNTRETAKED
jgi:hypothetical protein